MESKAQISVGFVLCSINSNFESPNPNPILNEHRPRCTARWRHRTAGDGAACRRSAFRTMLYSTAAIERSTNGEGQRAEAGEGDRERNGGGQTEAERRQECTIQFERRSRSGRSSVASIPTHRLRTPSENWTADIRGLWCEAYLPYRQAYNYESTASCEHT